MTRDLTGRPSPQKNREALEKLSQGYLKPMTRADALAEARRRWGAQAIVKHERRWLGLFRVGYYEVPRFSARKRPVDVFVGSGDSWEAAFSDARAK